MFKAVVFQSFKFLLQGTTSLLCQPHPGLASYTDARREAFDKRDIKMPFVSVYVHQSS